MYALQRTTASDPRFGFSAAVLETGTGQPEAQALYERCGYVHVEQFPPYVGLPLSVCMRKTL